MYARYANTTSQLRCAIFDLDRSKTFFLIYIFNKRTKRDSPPEITFATKLNT
nr:MAG TPA: hypothetical protein [Caudoviricetes sp.]